MRFAPGLSLSAVPALAGRPHGAVTSTSEQRSIPAGVLPAMQADMTDLGNWTLDPDWSDADGAVRKATGSVQSFVTSQTVAIPPGDAWVCYTVKAATAGTVGVQLQGPFRNTPFANKVNAQHVARFASEGHTKVRIAGSPTFDGEVHDLQVVDMGALLAQPSDIYIAAGQSLIASESSSLPVDPDLDFWLPRCLYMPGSSNATFGIVAGQPAACVAPLQMVQVSQGVSPATTFARVLEPLTPQGRTILIVCSARGGSSLVGGDAQWNPDGTTGEGGTLYAAMVAQVQAALALNTGNAVRGLLWGQGETDRSATIATDYPPAFAAMIARLRGDIGVPGLPVILIGPMPDDTTTYQPAFIAMQEKLDQDSGDVTAISGVHYVARPAGYMSPDGTHPLPEGSRIAGRLAAQRFVAEGHI